MNGFEESELTWKREGKHIVLKTTRMTIILDEHVAKELAAWIVALKWC